MCGMCSHVIRLSVWVLVFSCSSKCLDCFGALMDLFFLLSIHCNVLIFLGMFAHRNVHERLRKMCQLVQLGNEIIIWDGRSNFAPHFSCISMSLNAKQILFSGATFEISYSSA
jgi:hypothetical protein